MDIRAELVSLELAKTIARTLDRHLKINLDEIANTTAIMVLAEVQKAVQKCEATDFEIVEEIVCIFEKYNLSCGGTHDFSLM